MNDAPVLVLILEATDCVFAGFLKMLILEAFVCKVNQTPDY